MQVNSFSESNKHFSVENADNPFTFNRLLGASLKNTALVKIVPVVRLHLTVKSFDGRHLSDWLHWSIWFLLSLTPCMPPSCLCAQIWIVGA